jgi:lipopolysaccharide biosynthesis regulator YciM
MFKGNPNVDGETITSIYEIDKNFENALQRCLELFGDGADDMAETVSRFRQEFAHENYSDSEESEEEKEEVKMPIQEHRKVKVVNFEE